MGGLPPVTLALLVANVLVYFLENTSPGIFEWFALWPGQRFEPWQVVTYAFLHGSVMHIFFNMLGLYMFGSDIERLFGSRFYALYYLASIVAAAICHLIVTGVMGSPPYPTVGASGGVFGLVLAYAIYFPHRRLMLLFPPIPMSARTFAIVFAALELFFGVTGTVSGVAHFAHLGGMIGGWLMIQYRRKKRIF
jgi:membrane associated rhomboid family serine protease